MNNYLVLIAGIVAAGVGGELFVRGLIGVAHWARIPAGIVGATVAAFATSSPELSVAVLSAIEGRPELSLGDALGSNVVNVALVLGLALVVSAIHCPRDTVRRDFPVALLAPVLTGLLAYDGEISRLDAAILFAAFLAWLVWVVIETRRRRSAASSVLDSARIGSSVAFSAAGLGLLVLAGWLIVSGGTGIAASLGVSAFVVGAAVVAVGTSVPELATAIISKLRGHDEIGLGTVLGSNVFNGLFIVPVAAVITPIAAPWRDVVVSLSFGVVVLAMSFPARNGKIGRVRGVSLIAVYGFYVAGVLAPW